MILGLTKKRARNSHLEFLARSLCFLAALSSQGQLELLVGFVIVAEAHGEHGFASLELGFGSDGCPIVYPLARRQATDDGRRRDDDVAIVALDEGCDVVNGTFGTVVDFHFDMARFAGVETLILAGVYKPDVGHLDKVAHLGSLHHLTTRTGSGISYVFFKLGFFASARTGVGFGGCGSRSHHSAGHHSNQRSGMGATASLHYAAYGAAKHAAKIAARGGSLELMGGGTRREQEREAEYGYEILFHEAIFFAGFDIMVIYFTTITR